MRGVDCMYTHIGVHTEVHSASSSHYVNWRTIIHKYCHSVVVAVVVIIVRGGIFVQVYGTIL